MPGWHAKTKELVAAGKLRVAGIVQEQHPNRAALFMQWQQMDWPVYSDPLNLLGVYAIPHTFLIDSHGIIRYKNPKPADLKTFLTTNYAAPKKIDRPDLTPVKGSAEHQLTFHQNTQTTAAITQLEQQLNATPDDSKRHFRLGVAYRMRYDSANRQAEDFAKAVAAWQRALELNPAQYIWRRRIQQYGPRLDKPYSFYDWVSQARKEITARGEIPHALAAEPGGSEFANSTGATASKPSDQPHPDPEAKLPHDTTFLVKASAIAVPSTNKRKQAYRIHLRFQPSATQKVHWTNDAGNLEFFINENPAFTIHDRQQSSMPPKKLTSSEERSVEFEVRPTTPKGKLPQTISGTAFYYVCEDVNGACQYLRQDIEIQLTD